MTTHNETHESAALHVTGAAIYTDDIPLPADTLHAYCGLSRIASGCILNLDLSPVKAVEGVKLVLTAEDIPHNDLSPVGANDEPVLTGERISFHGQPIFVVIATSREIARRAAKLAIVEYQTDDALILDVHSAKAAGSALVCEPLTLARGDADTAMQSAPNQLSGQLSVGGQDHFYLETHIAVAIPSENDGVNIYSSTQHPSEVQHMVAHCLGLASHDVIVSVRRMGGGFGGKETQGNFFAVIAALAANRLNRAVKFRPDRDDDMVMTGKRHDFVNEYEVGFDDDGRILAVKALCQARAGMSADLSGPVTDRALFHADNAYYYPDVQLQSAPLRTNTVSNTAFRGFGGPQGLIMAEQIVESIARVLGKDPLDIRLANLYGVHGNITPYHQEVKDDLSALVLNELAGDCEYRGRRAAIRKFNAENVTKKRGIAITPVKFGISFTATWFNQAGALVHIYRDGTLQVNHGGTEMGQGLFTKMRAIAALAFGLSDSAVRVMATSTEKVPNTSATAASSGADLNGMAVQNACETLKARLVDFLQTEAFQAPFLFENGTVIHAKGQFAFAELVERAYMARVSLSSTGFYKTPDISWDRAKGRGEPFYYFAYGAACSEVEVDRFTGDYQVLQTDILHDCGTSLNEAIDIGQIEGGFVQGMGWLTREELVWNENGALLTHAPSTYKIPLASDIPKKFNVKLLQDHPNPRPTIRRSKAVGEPPFMLANSVFFALQDAIGALGDPHTPVALDAPATPERVYNAMVARGGRL